MCFLQAYKFDMGSLKKFHVCFQIPEAVGGTKDLDQVNYNLIRKRMIAGPVPEKHWPFTNHLRVQGSPWYGALVTWGILATDMKHHGQHALASLTWELKGGDLDSSFISEFFGRDFFRSDDLKQKVVMRCESIHAEVTILKEFEVCWPQERWKNGLHFDAAMSWSLQVPFMQSWYLIYPMLSHLWFFCWCHTISNPFFAQPLPRLCWGGECMLRKKRSRMKPAGVKIQNRRVNSWSKWSFMQPVNPGKLLLKRQFGTVFFFDVMDAFVKHQADISNPFMPSVPSQKLKA